MPGLLKFFLLPGKPIFGEFVVIEELLDVPGQVLRDPDDNSVLFDDLHGACKAKRPHAELAKLKQGSGGLPLTYSLMTLVLQSICKVMYVATKETWNYYTFLTRHVKNAQQGLSHTMSLARSWQSAAHLGATFRTSLYDPEQLNYLGIGPRFGPEEQSRTICRCVALSWSIVSERAWSLAARYGIAPITYCSLLGGGGAPARDLMLATMQNDHKNLTFLESRRHLDTFAKELWNDVGIGESYPVRAMYSFFERDQFKMSRDGLKVLRGMCEGFPHNKHVEELHHSVRMRGKGNPNKKLTAPSIQEAVLHSGVLESYGFAHGATVTKAAFVKKWRCRKNMKMKRGRFHAWTHKLPEKWSQIMGRKYWASTTEVTERHAAAGWAWLQEVGPARGSAVLADGLSVTLWSRLLDKLMIFQRVDGSTTWACLGNGKWAVLAWPLEHVVVAEQDHFRMQLQGGRAAWHFITNPVAYNVVSWQPVFVNDYCILLRSAGVEPLPTAALRQSARLGYDDLVRLARFFKLETPTRLSRLELLQGLAEAVCPGDEDFRKLVSETGNALAPLDLLADDPMFEAAFDELCPEDKSELREVRAAIEKKKVSAHRATRHLKRSRDGYFQPRAKAKPKAKAKAASPPPEPSPLPPPPAPPGPAAGLYGGNYQYVVVGDKGHLVYSSLLRKMNAHCLCPTHQTDKCHMDRSISQEVDYSARKFKGRFVGLHLAWLHYECASKAEHHDMKKILGSVEYFWERSKYRTELWEMRHEVPGVQDLFALEAPPPSDYVGEPQLWEPECVF